MLEQKKPTWVAHCVNMVFSVLCFFVKYDQNKLFSSALFYYLLFDVNKYLCSSDSVKDLLQLIWCVEIEIINKQENNDAR